MNNFLTGNRPVNLAHIFRIEIAEIAICIYTDEEIIQDYVTRIFQLYRVDVFRQNSKIIRLHILTKIDAQSNSIPPLLKQELQEENPPHTKRDNRWTLSVDSRKIIAVSKTEAFCLLKVPVKKKLDSFYYNYLHPVMLELWFQNGLLYCHGAGILHRKLGPLVIIAPRMMGKTTLTLSFLRAGHEILSDDTLLFCLEGSKGQVYTLLRPLHADPDLSVIMGMEKEFSGSEEYLPGTNRVALDVHELFANQVVNELPWPNAIIIPRIVGEGATEAKSAHPAMTAVRILTQCYPGLEREKQFKQFRRFVKEILELPALDLKLGQDSLANPELPVRLLEQRMQHIVN